MKKTTEELAPVRGRDPSAMYVIRESGTLDYIGYPTANEAYRALIQLRRPEAFEIVAPDGSVITRERLHEAATWESSRHDPWQRG
jgi:hypothetical protein